MMRHITNLRKSACIQNAPIAFSIHVHYNIAYDEVSREDKRVQDLLHEVELAQNAAERNRAAARLQKSRRWRRENKDTVLYYKSVVDFFSEKGNRNTLNQMRQLLGRQRKEEEYVNSERIYYPRAEKAG